MKAPWITCFFISGMIFFTCCKNHSAPASAGNQEPVFSSDPNLKNITEQINNSPKNATLYFERGSMLHKMKIDTLALKDYKMAATLDSTKAEYYSAVGNLLFDHKDINGSIDWIKKAIAKDPSDTKSHLKIAKLFLYIHQYPSALTEINLVLRKSVFDPEAYFLKGMVYKEVKDTAKAISSFLTAVQVAPDYREATIQLGMLYSAKKDPIALQYLENAYKEDSTDVFPVFAEGVYYQNNNDYNKAKEAYKRCIMRNGHYADAFFNMGYVLMQQDSVEKAYRQYDIVTKIDPSNPTAYYDRGVCNEQLKKMPEAVSDYKQAYLLDTAYNSPKAALKRLKVKI